MCLPHTVPRTAIQAAYKYIHALLSKIVTSHGDITGVLGRLDLLYLHSMTSEPVHLGYVVADYIRHQRQYRRMSVLFAGTSITHLIRGMGLIKVIHEIEKMSNMTPLSLASFRVMGVIRQRSTSGHALIMDSVEEFDKERDATEDSPTAPSESLPATVPMETENNAPSLAK